MQKTNIPWCTHTWNPVVGCSKIKDGCVNCYAYKLHNQRHKAYLANKRVPAQYAFPFRYVQTLEHRLDEPLKCRAKDAKIFVCSMSDLFHEKVPFEFIDKVMAVIALCPQHTFQFLTKRPERMLEYYQSRTSIDDSCRVDRLPQWYNVITNWLDDGNKGYLGWYWEKAEKAAEQTDFTQPLKNLWLGTSISTQADADKNIPILLQIPAAVRFVSLEPLLPGRINLKDCLLDGGLSYKILSRHYSKDGFDPKGSQPEREKPKIDWVIVGCESGPKARLCSIEDIRDVVWQCRAANVPVFVKQVPVDGKCNKDSYYWPEDLRIQEYPKMDKS